MKIAVAESLITITDDGIAGSSLDHKIFSFPILAYVNFMLTKLKSPLCKSSCWQWHSTLKFRRSYRFTFSVTLSWFKKVLITLVKHRLKIAVVASAETTDRQTLSSVFKARVINCFCSSELVGFFSRFVLFHQSKLDYHSRLHGHNLRSLANQYFCPNVRYIRYLNLAFVEWLLN